MVAQSMIFFLAGFIGTANTLCFLAYELAANPEIQAKLYEEVAQVAESSGDEPITYEQLQKMQYLDCIVSETMRKWPITLTIERNVTKQYVMENNDGSKVVLQPGQTIWIPSAGIHHDPTFYPEPEQFRPERFLPDAEPKIDIATYLAFGVGPRACIASRFALMQLKATAYQLVRKLRFEFGPNTKLPLKIQPLPGSTEPENDFSLLFKLRH